MSSSFFTLCTDESMCSMRSALLNVEVDVHVRLDICISFDDSFIASAEIKGLDWKTHELPKCSWVELPSGFHHCQFSLVQKSKEFLRWIFWLVWSDHASAVFGVLFPTIIVVRIFWNFRFEFNSKCVFVLSVRRNMARKHACFVNIFVSWYRFEVGSFWMMVLGSLLEVIVLAGDLEHSWQCMVFDMMPIALQTSIDWCDLLNHMFWSLRWCVHVQVGCDGSSMVRLGCGFFDHFVDAS